MRRKKSPAAAPSSASIKLSINSHIQYRKKEYFARGIFIKKSETEIPRKPGNAEHRSENANPLSSKLDV